MHKWLSCTNWNRHFNEVLQTNSNINLSPILTMHAFHETTKSSNWAISVFLIIMQMTLLNILQLFFQLHFWSICVSVINRQWTQRTQGRPTTRSSPSLVCLYIFCGDVQLHNFLIEFLACHEKWDKPHIHHCQPLLRGLTGLLSSTMISSCL